MNQIQFETSKVFGVFVMLPDGAKAWKNESYHITTLWYKTEEMRLPKAIDLPNENYKILGFVSNLTDEQKERVVDSYHNEVGSLYVDYSTNTYQFMKVSESFASLLTSLNVLLVNPYKFPSTIDHEFYDEPYDGTGFYQGLYSGAMEQWQTAQQHVGTWVLLTSEK